MGPLVVGIENAHSPAHYYGLVTESEPAVHCTHPNEK